MHSQFEEYIGKRFSITLPEDYFIEERSNKVYICKHSLRDISFPRLQRRGLLAGKLWTLYGIKPSLDFALVFGHLAAKNYAVIDDDTVKSMYNGGRIESFEECECADGIILIKDKRGRGVGVALYVKGHLKPLIPKDRLAQL